MHDLFTVGSMDDGARAVYRVSDGDVFGYVSDDAGPCLLGLLTTEQACERWPHLADDIRLDNPL